MNTAKLSVLLIEDNDADVRLVREVLRNVPEIELHAVNRLALGVDHLASHPTDIVLLDLGLPDSEGLDSLQAMVQAAPHLPVIVITGQEDETVAQTAIRRGAQDYVIKPIMSGLLFVRIIRFAYERNRIDAALKQSEAKYRRLHDSIRDGFLYVNMEGKICESNESYEKMLGYTFEELSRLSYVDLTPEKWHAYEQRIVDEYVLPRGYSDVYEKEYIRKDGSVFPVELRTLLLKKDNGENEGMWAIVRDITERKRSEKIIEIRVRLLEYASSHSLDELIGAALDEICLLIDSPIGFFHFLSPDEKFVSLQSWSKNTLDHFCTTKSRGLHYEIEKAGVWVDCIRERKPVIHNDYASLPHRKGMPEGHAAVIRELTVPIIRDNKIVAVIGIGNKPTDYTEEDVRVVSFLADVTWEIVQKKISGEALRESEERYKSFIEKSIAGVYVVQDGVFVFLNDNAASYAGYKPDDLIGRNSDMIIHPEDKKVVKEKAQKMLAGDDLTPYVFRIVTKTGQTRWIMETVSSIPYNGKKAILGNSMDITDLKRTEEEREKLQAQLSQAQKMEAVGLLAGGVAHDYNNMLGVILGHTEMAMAKLDPSQPLHASLDEIYKATIRSADITRQLLAFARKQKIMPAVLDLNQTVEGMLKMLRRLIGENIDIAWLPGRNLDTIKMDPAQVGQILANLCVNARDAIADIGKISIETKNVIFDDAYCMLHPGFHQGHYVLLAVSDNGCGMDKEILNHIFEPFFTSKEVGKGTGLGLSTVYGIVKQNEGFINVYSEPGTGTTFRIYLPRHTDEAAAAKREAETAVPRGSGETVMVIEDEPALLALTEMMLEKLGYRVIAAYKPSEAIKLVNTYEDEIHLLITDVVMPEINCRALAEQLQSCKPNMQVLYMSGYTSDVIAHRGILTDGTHFLQKPFSLKELAVEVRKILKTGT